MIVVGGTYREAVANPGTTSLRGSGFRAAAALREITDVRLVTAIDDEEKDVARLTAGGLDLDVEWLRRSEPVAFHYFTPLSSPSINGRLALVEKDVTAEGSTILVFGMLEVPLTQMHLSATSMILDPQQPRDLRHLDLSKLRHERFAIVANGVETRSLGGTSSVTDAARALLATYECDVVVTKLGAQGALVTTHTEQEMVGPFPTERVWPLGSGDVFAAAFAYFWGEKEQEPVVAARASSRAVAEWCGNPPCDDHAIREDLPVREELIKTREGCVYLAAPFFNLSERWLVELVVGSLDGLGLKVFSPMHDVGPGGIEVARLDLEGLDRATAVLALLDGSDPGTVFETGYATKLALPIVGYAEQPNPEAVKMLDGSGAEIHDDLSTAVYRSAWAALGYPLSQT